MKPIEPEKLAFKRASSIEVPEEFFNPIKVGYPEVDNTFSEIGGIVPSQVIFATGPPGAGKTTLTLAIGAKITKPAKPVAFISLEMSDFQLKHQAKKIPNFGNVMVTTEFDQEETFRLLEEMNPCLIILDSLQKAASRMRTEDGKEMASNTAQVKLTELFTNFAKRTWIPVILIGHCDKAGNYKGPSSIVHEVDSHLHVKYDKEFDTRSFEFSKNRFGGMVREEPFGITSERVWIGSPYEEEAGLGLEEVLEGLQPFAPEKKLVERVHLDRMKLAKGCIAELEKNWNGGNIKATINSVFELLRNEDTHILEHGVVNDPKKLKLAYRGKGVAHCHSHSGEIVFGTKTFNPGTFMIGRVGYGKEQKYIQQYCKTPAQLLVWVTLHEWTHLYKGMQHHKNTFFLEVEKLAKRFNQLLED